MMWKLTFIFFAGFMLREVLGHIWLIVDGLLPFTSRLFGFTITPDMNMVFIAVGSAMFLIFAYFGFLFDWEGRAHREIHA